MLQLLHVHPQPFGLYPQVSVYNNNSIRQTILISIMAYSSCNNIIAGMICEQPLQTCRTDLSACGDNGYCSTRTGTTTTASYCSCYPGYIGETCNQVMMSCDTTTQAPCLHQGYLNINQICVVYLYMSTEPAIKLLVEVEMFHLVVVVAETGGDFIVQVHIFTVCFEYLQIPTVPCCLM